MGKIEDEIKKIEQEMARTQKNKATAKHLASLKSKLAKLKRQLLQDSIGGKSGGGSGFDVSKAGSIARCGFVGFPSVGKSTLLNKLTTTHSEVGAYEFTTLTAVPGILRHKGCPIQILDLPGIIEGAKDNRGRGRQVISSATTCDVIIIVLDAAKPCTHLKKILKELNGFGIRLNQTRPEIRFKKKEAGGINISSKVELTHLDTDTIKTVLKEYRINSADLMFREDATVDQLIDIIEDKHRYYIKSLYVLNKIDQITIQELDLLDRLPNCVPISAQHGWNMDGLVARIWKELDLIRIYCKPKGEIVNFEEPVVLKRKRRTVEDFCNRIHKDIVNQLKHAVVWGSSGKFANKGNIVSKKHILNDEDIVQIVKGNVQHKQPINQKKKKKAPKKKEKKEKEEKD